MSSATVTALANRIAGLTLTDATAVANYQDDIFFEIARGALPGITVQVAASFLAATRNTAQYALATGSGHRTLLMLIYDDTQLSQADFEELYATDPEWRDHPGCPVAFTLDPVDRDKYQLMPPPDQDSGTVAGSPTSFTTWPTNVITTIVTRTDVAWSGTPYADTIMPVAFEVLAREFSRDSDHKDEALAKMSKQMAQLFWKLSFPSADR
jgi:hypothetical protein